MLGKHLPANPARILELKNIINDSVRELISEQENNNEEQNESTALAPNLLTNDPNIKICC